MSLARIQALRRVDRGTSPARGALRVVEQQFAVLQHHDEVHLEAARGHVGGPASGGHIGRDLDVEVLLAATPDSARPRLVSALDLDELGSAGGQPRRDGAVQNSAGIESIATRCRRPELLG